MSFKSFISGTEPSLTPPPGELLDFDVDEVVFLLDIDERPVDRANALDVAFDWSATPQGDGFWAEQCDALERGEELSDEAEEYLRSLIRSVIA